jgi:hypothetical protein
MRVYRSGSFGNEFGRWIVNKRNDSTPSEHLRDVAGAVGQIIPGDRWPSAKPAGKVLQRQIVRLSACGALSLLPTQKALIALIEEEERMAEKLKGEGRLVPTRPTGVEYRVVYGIELVPEVRQHGVPPAVAKSRWARCQVKSQHARQIPDGTYFLHADEGRVHQLKSKDGKWEYLAAA